MASSSLPAANDPAGDGLSTREKILVTAERLFAEKGYGAVSLRSITRECEVNLAAIHYHFGSKERLLEEIFESHCGPMNDQRIRLLNDCREAPGRLPLLEQLLDAYLRPTLEIDAGDLRARRFMRLRAILGYEREELARNLIARHFNKVSRLFLRRLREVLPHLGERELYWRFHFLLGAHYYTMANPGRIQVLSGGACDPSDGAQANAHIVPFLAAALNAPAVDPVTEPEISE